MEITSPGSSVMTCDRYSTVSGILKMSWRVLDRCRTSPAMLRLRSRVCGSGFILEHEGWAHRAMRIEGLAHHPLRGGELIVTGAHIVDYGISGNIIQGAFAWDVMTGASDNEGEFRLIVDLLCGAWDENGCTGSNHAIVVLGKQRRYLGDLLACFFGVVAVIEAQRMSFPGRGIGALSATSLGMNTTHRASILRPARRSRAPPAHTPRPHGWPPALVRQPLRYRPCLLARGHQPSPQPVDLHAAPKVPHKPG